MKLAISKVFSLTMMVSKIEAMGVAYDHENKILGK
jgi:hypothetical protein